MQDSDNTRGLPLARAFFKAYEQRLRDFAPSLMQHAAFGLVGEGSECFGCDDEISRDHDWGPAFCIWLPQAELEANAERLENALSILPARYAGYPVRMSPELRMDRVGPMSTENFYARFTGLKRPPETWQEWRRIPEASLAVCTNGEVFSDGDGGFTRWRNALLAYYPRDLWLKKMARRCMRMAQAGQYNLPRALQRGAQVYASLALSHFVTEALGLLFLLNRRFTPFDKWAWRLGQDLPLLGEEVTSALYRMVGTSLTREGAEVCQQVEELCTLFAATLRDKGLSDEEDSWLWAHGPQLAARIANPDIARLNLLED